MSEVQKINHDQEKKERSLIESLLYYIKIILKYKKNIIITTSIVSILVAVFLLISTLLPADQSPLPNIYTAQITLFIQSEGGSGLAALISPSFGEGSPFDSLFSNIDLGDLAMSVIYSNSFIYELAKELNVEKRYKMKGAKKIDLRQAILNRININHDRRRNIMMIGYQDIDPVFARDMVNKIAETLIRWFSEKGGTRKANIKTTLEKKLLEVTEEISKIETKIRNFQKKYGVLTAEELAKAHSDLLRDLNSQLMLKDLEIKNHSSLVKIEDSRLQRLRIERKNILELIQQVENGNTGRGENLPPKDEVPELLLEIRQLEMDLTIQNNIYQTLLEQYEVIKLSAEIDNPFYILEQAEVPEKKSEPNRFQILVIVFFITLIASMTIVLLHNYIKKYRGAIKDAVENK